MQGLRFFLRSRRHTSRCTPPLLVCNARKTPSDALSLKLQFVTESGSQSICTAARHSSYDQLKVRSATNWPSSFAASASFQGRYSNPAGVSGAAAWLRQFSNTPVHEDANSQKQQATPQQTKQTLSEAGWTHQAVYNIPNVLSVARLVSGPIIAWLILNEQWGVALVSLAISGASDWADGYVAKRFGQSSVLGSYLDPLADKVLIGSVVAALGYQGSLPLWLVSVIIGRDVILLSGAFVHRFKTVGWRWPGAAEFFRVSSSSSSAQSSTASNRTGHMQHSDSVNTSEGSTETSSNYAETHEVAGGSKAYDNNKGSHGIDDSISSINSVGSLRHNTSNEHFETNIPEAGRASASGKAPPAVFVQPLYISKVNTCFQLLLVSGCLTSSWYAWPPQEALAAMGVATGGTTLASCGAYARAYLSGTIK